MKCPNPSCNAVLSPGAKFCGKCATRVPAPPTAAPSATAVRGGAYKAEISRLNPGCLVFLIDQSGSMEEPIAGGSGLAKKNVVADAINRLIHNAVLRCAKEDGVRPYLDIGIWTYGGANEVRSPVGGGLTSVAAFTHNTIRVETRKRRVPDGMGGLTEVEDHLPFWFDPVANGMTPMSGAFRAALVPVREWVAKHPHSFPPIVVNLTDGAYTDSDPAPVANELRSLATSDGNVLVFNGHISSQPGITVAFAGNARGAELQGLARELFNLSSPLPEPLLRAAKEKGYGEGPDTRGYVFNADIVTMIDFLNIGTRAIQDRMETG